MAGALFQHPEGPTGRFEGHDPTGIAESTQVGCVPAVVGAYIQDLGDALMPQELHQLVGRVVAGEPGDVDAAGLNKSSRGVEKCHVTHLN
jgi:hypothetical protein